MQLSKKMLKISPSGTVILAQKARQLKAEGKDIIELGEGEPDFNTPEFIIKYAYQSAKNGATKYTSVSGTQELNNKINALLAELVSSLDQKQRKNYRQRINFFIKSLDRIIDNYI